MEMEDLSSENYRLSRVIEAHAADVKSIVAVNETGAIISGSRDERVKLFAEKDGGFEQFVEINNSLVVNSVEVFSCPDGSILIFCGRKDGSIAVFNPESQKPQFMLTEHSLNVCVLKINQVSGQLISGSWDSRAVVFDINDLIFNRPAKKYALEGHRNSIWGVEFVSGRQSHYLTASADKTIKLWDGNTSTFTFSGHKDVVRCLLSLNEERFVSAGNDSTVRLWNMSSGKCEQVHESTSGEFIYSMSMIRANEKRLIATCGESGYIEMFTVELDNTMTYGQIIRSPVTSLWSARFLPNTDLAVAASNGYVYIFSAVPDRFAPPTIQEVFDSSVAAKVAMEAEMRAAQDTDTVTIKVSLDDGAPNLELKYVKGTNPVDAAEIFIKENNLPYSYLNEITDYIKANVPEAQNYNSYKPSKATGIQQKGKADYNFDITVEGGRKLVLGYNVGDDPEFTVQKFCEDNNLPIKFIGQLSTLIKAQVPELQGLQGQAYSDPFTGQGRHVPSFPGAADSASFGGDPFTSGRYIPGSATTNGSSNTGGGDPFTSGGRYIPGQDSSTSFVPNSLAPIDKRRPRSDLVPVRQFYTFGHEGASAKAQEALKNANTGVGPELSLEEPLIESLLQILGGNFVASEIEVMALEKALQWPLEFIVPALDAFRLGLLDPTINEYFCSVQGENRGAQTLERLSAILISEPAIPVRILICRALANATKHQPGRDMISLNLSQLSEIITRQITSSGSKPALQLAAASFLANIALILLRKTERGVCAELGPREDVLRSIIKCTETVNSFGDCSEHSLQRLLQAIVTLMWGDSTIIDLAKSRGIDEIVMRVKDAVKTDDSKNISRDIYAMTN